jgi:acyl-CoA thioesterase
MATSRLTLGGVGGSVHGGLLASLVDIAMLEAMFPSFGTNDQPAGTADLNITYLRPALGAKVIAEATVLRKGKTLAVTEVSILDEGGNLCAKGRTIYVIRQRQA